MALTVNYHIPLNKINANNSREIISTVSYVLCNNHLQKLTHSHTQSKVYHHYFRKS